MKVRVEVDRIERVEDTYIIDDVPDELYDEDDDSALNDWAWENVWDHDPTDNNYYDSETSELTVEVIEPPKQEEPEKEDWE